MKLKDFEHLLQKLKTSQLTNTKNWLEDQLWGENLTESEKQRLAYELSANIYEKNIIDFLNNLDTEIQ